MKFIFFGTPDFAARFLDGIIERGFVPAAVVTNPDRPVGRKQVITPPAVKVAAERWNALGQNAPIEILQPEKLDADFQEKIRAMEADFFVVYAYGKIFRKAVLDIPRLGIVGVHPSFLPKYRGPSPFLSALLQGERETGVTLYLLTEGIDDGPMLAKSKPTEITRADTSVTIAERLADMGAELFAANIAKFFAGEITPEPQDETQATFTKKFTSEDGFVDPVELATSQMGDSTVVFALDRKIRALNPEPGVWTKAPDGARVKLLEAEIRDSNLHLLVAQREGEKPKKIG